MSPKRRSVTFMMHRDGDLKSQSLRLPLWLVRTGVITGSVLSVLVVVGAVLYTPIARTAARVPSLNREIERLRAENEQVHELAATLEEMEARYDQVREVMGADVMRARPLDESEQAVAYPIVVRVPSEEGRYEEGPSAPRHWPLEESGIVTRGTIASNTGGEPHSGLDIAIAVGTPIRATGGGVVVQAGEDPEYGLFVLLEHPEGYRSMYGHASRLLVSSADTVAAGQVIALSGSTGRSTAPHLHFEILHEGRSIDPRSLVREES
jgi:murein DD-endopeptidase MepM/ murein hydrolase activator NlpD